MDTNNKSTIHFALDADRYLDNVTWDMLIKIDNLKSDQSNKGIPPELAKELCAIFITDENGKYYPYDKALDLLGKYTARQIFQMTNELIKFMKKLGESELPLAIEAALSTPSTTDSPSP